MVFYLVDEDSFREALDDSFLISLQAFDGMKQFAY